MLQDVARTGQATAAPDTRSNGAKSILPGPKIEVNGDGKGRLLKSVSVGVPSIATYASIVGLEQIEELMSLAAELKGARVLHISSTAYGGGVAEILRSHIPLLRSLGICTEWMIIPGDDTFFGVTKGFHNALQGGEYHLDAKGKEIYLASNSLNARYLEGDYDYIVVHDPQPVAIRLLHGDNNAKWVWRCHIDTSNPDQDVWNFLKPYVEAYDASIFTMENYVPPDLSNGNVAIIPPAIDPLSPKNTPLPKDLSRKIVGWAGIAADRPLITQVSRFDPWKDPLGVIEVYRKVKKHLPGLQLAMLGHIAMDDPEGWEIYNQGVDRQGAKTLTSTSSPISPLLAASK